MTGGAGFLGSCLCERLVDGGHDVICLDNFFTSQKINVSHLLERTNFELIRHDITMPIWLEVDEIYSLACPAAPGHYQYNAIKTIKTSVLGAINVLGMAKRCHGKVLQASTSEVYGDPEVHPQPEKALSDGPNMVRLQELRGLLVQLQAIWEVSGKGNFPPLT